jgi:excinuclease ABC subunit C
MANSPPILERIKTAPQSTGVYVMHDRFGKVIYVGKATNLRSRLRSYFTSTPNQAYKVGHLARAVADFEYTITDTDTEALLLENTLIKKHKPKYNANLKDDKTYPFLKIDLSEDFPQPYFTRRFQSDNARYFGPFSSAGSLRKTMTLLNKLFPYRSCTKAITGTDARPCLEYHIKRCAGPCIGAIGKEDYRDIIQQVILFMEGKTKPVITNLKTRMMEAAKQLQFETAATLRDQIKAIEQISEKQKVIAHGKLNQDAIAFARGGDEAWVEVFYFRQGKLENRDHFLMNGVADKPDSVVMEAFIQQFYDLAPYVPKEIVLQHDLNECKAVIRSWLEQKKGSKVHLTNPKRGSKVRLVRMIAENANQKLKERALKWLSDASNLGQALDEIAEALTLSRKPNRIECYDISNIQGSNPVGSMVVFENGRAINGQYRRFQIKSTKTIDDYSMMKEVLTRRFSRLISQKQSKVPNTTFTTVHSQRQASQKDASWGKKPDLVIIDGGKGHLSAALQVLLELGLQEHIPVASLAKKNEELFVPHEPDPILLPKGSQALFLVQRIRDEAHRFAITYHRKRRSKQAILSTLDSIPGVGPIKRRSLIQSFGSAAGVRKASAIDISKTPGINITLAKRIKLHLA